MSTQTWWRRLDDRVRMAILALCSIALGATISLVLDRLPGPLAAVALVGAVVGICVWAVREYRLMERQHRMWNGFTKEMNDAGGFDHMPEERRRYWLHRMDTEMDILKGVRRRAGLRGDGTGDGG